MVNCGKCDMTTFGGRMKALRLGLGESLRAFARRCGYDAAYLSRIERGLVAPPQDGGSYGNSLRRLLFGLGLRLREPAWQEMVDLAAVAAGRVPPDYENDASLVAKLPLLFAAGRKYSRKELLALAKKIRRSLT